MTVLKRLSLAFAAGALGVIALVVFLLVVRELGILKAIGAPVVPGPKMPEFLYGRITWGGIWGFLLVLPIMTQQWAARGAIVGVLASLAAIFYFNPVWMKASVGFIVLIFVANLIWGVVAAGWYRAVNR